MTVHSINDYKGGERLAAHDLNKLIEEVQRGAKITAQAPLMVYDGPAGRAIGFQNPEFWAVVCGVSGEGYVVKELKQAPSGRFSILSKGRRGTGFEVNGNVVPFGAAVRCYPGVAQGEYIFINCCTAVSNPIDCTDPDESSSSSSSGSSSGSSSESLSSLSLSSSSSGSADCGTTPACIPFVANAGCSSNRLVVDQQYLAMINGTLWVFNTAGGCAAGPCSSVSSSSESLSSSSSDSSSASSGSSSASSSVSSATSSDSGIYCFQNGTNFFCDTLHEGTAGLPKTGPYSTMSDCAGNCGSGSSSGSSAASSGSSSFVSSDSASLQWWGYDTGTECGCGAVDVPGSIVCGPFATESDCIAANCPCTAASSAAPSSGAP